MTGNDFFFFFFEIVSKHFAWRKKNTHTHKPKIKGQTCETHMVEAMDNTQTTKYFQFEVIWCNVKQFFKGGFHEEVNF